MGSTLRNERGRPEAPRTLHKGSDPLTSGRACRGARSRGGRRGVLELLLGAEQRVEHLLAQPLGQRRGAPPADDAEQQDAAEPAAALALLRRLVERHARVARAARGLADVLLQLL